MFIAGMNYGNGLALLFTFWLTGFALVAMVQTQRALTGITIHAATAQPAHAGGRVRMQLMLSGRTALQDLRAAVGSVQAAGARRADADDAEDASVPQHAGAAQRGWIMLQLPAPRRGRWRAPPIRLSSVAPFGLFEA